jgi:hypothetical protein
MRLNIPLERLDTGARQACKRKRWAAKGLEHVARDLCPQREAATEGVRLTAMPT